MSPSYILQQSFISVAWLHHMCGMTPSLLRHGLFIRVACLLHKYYNTPSYVWHDSYTFMHIICATWLIPMCNINHLICAIGCNQDSAPLRMYADLCCRALRSVAVCCSVLQRVAAYRFELPCAAMCCSVLQCVAVYYSCSMLHWVAVCRSVSQCVAMCRNV